MKLVQKVEFNEEEEQALQTIAGIPCKGIACDECPFARKEIINERTDDCLYAGCLIIDIRHICTEHRIEYFEQ